jgi:hypothetical protein
MSSPEKQQAPSMTNASLRIRPTLIEDEWWDGYVSRTLAENGYPASSPRTLAQFEHLVTNYVDASHAKHHKIDISDNPDLCTFGSHLLPKWAVLTSHSAVKVCRHCLAENAYVRMHWRLHASAQCAIHNSDLISTCPDCQREWAVTDVAKGQCKCGLLLPLSSHQQGDSPEPSGGFNAHGRNGKKVEAPGELQLSIACKVLMHRLTGALEIVRVYVMGPNGNSMLARTFSPIHIATPDVPSFAKLWRTLHSQSHLNAAFRVICEVMHAEKSSRTLLSVLPLWDFAKDLAYLGAEVQAMEQKGLLQAGLLVPGYVPLKIAAKRAGIAASTLQALKDRGVFEAEKVFSVGDGRFLYSPSQIEQLSKFKGGEGYGANLGSKETTVLRMSNLIPLLASSNGRPWIDPMGLSNLLADLEAVAVDRAVDRSALVRLSDSCIWRWDNIDFIRTLFEKLQSIEFHLYSDRASTGFSRFFIGSDAMSWLGSQARGRDDSRSAASSQSDFFSSKYPASSTPVKPCTRSSAHLRCSDKAMTMPPRRTSVQASLWT